MPPFGVVGPGSSRANKFNFYTPEFPQVLIKGKILDIKLFTLLMSLVFKSIFIFKSPFVCSIFNIILNFICYTCMRHLKTMCCEREWISKYSSTPEVIILFTIYTIRSNENKISRCFLFPPIWCCLIPAILFWPSLFRLHFICGDRSTNRWRSQIQWWWMASSVRDAWQWIFPHRNR